MKSTIGSAAAILAFFSAASAQSSAPTCSPSKQCSSDAPCCSQYGQCGVGAYCLGGCDPKSSFNMQSCMPSNTCKSQDYKLTSLDDVAKNTVYLGDGSKANWVSSGTPVAYNSDSLLLTMAPSTVGTLLSSTHYVWYGKVCATMTTSQGKGVVTAFILMSDMKDEIDFEFVGDDVQHAQTNYYYQGITDYHNMDSLDVSDTRKNVHEYCIDWKPDTTTWSIDGKSMRTLNKDDTWNTSTNSYHYPQTPARVQLSLWPAGLSSNGEGTVEWAGGLVDWNSPYMQNGYYYAMVNDVSVECYDPPSGFSNNFGDKSYYYTSIEGTNNTVAIGNNNTILSSFMASGNNPTYGAQSSGSSSATSSAPTMSNTPESVPGMSGGGNVASSGQAPTESDSGSGSGTDSGSASSSSGQSSTGGFSQGGSSSDTSQAPKIFAGSAVALIGFFVAALML